jgi:hypothetical protein
VAPWIGRRDRIHRRSAPVAESSTG